MIINIRKGIVQCHICVIGDRRYAKVRGYVGGESSSKLLTLTEGAPDLNLISSIEVAAAFELEGLLAKEVI